MFYLKLKELVPANPLVWIYFIFSVSASCLESLQLYYEAKAVKQSKFVSDFIMMKLLSFYCFIDFYSFSIFISKSSMLIVLSRSLLILECQIANLYKHASQSQIKIQKVNRYSNKLVCVKFKQAETWFKKLK